MPGPRKGVQRSSAPRNYVGVRLSTSGLEQLDQLAKDAGLQRSETIRLLLGYALASETICKAIKEAK